MTSSNGGHPRFHFSGARVLVTGGTSGIGAATAAAYRDAGAEVTITGTRGGPADYDGGLDGYRYLQLNSEDPASIDAVAAACPQLDIFVNNGGISLVSTGSDEHDPAIFDRTLSMLLIGPFRLAKKLESALTASSLAGGASIVSVASMSSFFGIGMLPAYGSAKTGLVGLTRSLAVAWGAKNIRVNAVAVGLTHSRMTADTIAQPEWGGHTLARTPLGRHGTPEDIAGPILFLTSSAAAWITGQTLPIDGGYSITG